jgi:hypothetical protein
LPHGFDYKFQHYEIRFGIDLKRSLSINAANILHKVTKSAHFASVLEELTGSSLKYSVTVGGYADSCATQKAVAGVVGRQSLH